MHRTSLSFLKQKTIFVLSIVLAPYYVDASNKLGPITKALSTQENICIPDISVGAMFSRTAERSSKTVYAHCCVFPDLYIFFVVKQQQTRCFLSSSPTFYLISFYIFLVI